MVVFHVGAFKVARRPSQVVLPVLRAGVAGTLLLVAGCASNTAPSYVQGPPHVAPSQPHKVEMEDDGDPVQPPPARAMRPGEDDPSQPWSPNYGQGAPTSAPPSPPNPNLPRQVDASAADAARPATAQNATQNTARAATTTGTLTHLDDESAAVLIAQAISVQEMRRQ